jgi:hypothetical protein
MQQSFSRALLCATAAAFVPLAAQASCGSAFCVLNTQWSTQGVPPDAGTARLDLRYEYVDQDELRSGKRRISAAEDTTADALEQRTLNRNWLATLDYTVSKNWSLTAQLPLVNRSHSHIEDPAGAATEENWKFTQGGDLRLLATYRFDNHYNPLASWGLSAGVKLPTGDYSVENSNGVRAERALQPGTGSTDFIYGAFYAAPGFTADASWWVQASMQQAIVTADDFRPGNQVQLNFGYRQPFTPALHGLLQLNSVAKSRDGGAEAEPDLSGSKSVFLSPGLTFALTKDLEAYGFYQKAIYRYVNGVQLSADHAWVLGMSVRF